MLSFPGAKQSRARTQVCDSAKKIAVLGRKRSAIGLLVDCIAAVRGGSKRRHFTGYEAITSLDKASR